MKDKVEQLRQELKEFSEKMKLKIAAIEKPSRWYSPEECKHWLTFPYGEFSSNLPLTEFQAMLAARFEGFPTKEDAEYYRDVPWLMRPLAKALLKLNDGWAPNWTNELQAKWIAVYSHISESWFPIDVVDCHHHSALYAKTEKIMKQALEIAQLDAPL